MLNPTLTLGFLFGQKDTNLENEFSNIMPWFVAHETIFSILKLGFVNYSMPDSKKGSIPKLIELIFLQLLFTNGCHY